MSCMRKHLQYYCEHAQQYYEEDEQYAHEGEELMVRDRLVYRISLLCTLWHDMVLTLLIYKCRVSAQECRRYWPTWLLLNAYAAMDTIAITTTTMTPKSVVSGNVDIPPSDPLIPSTP